MDIETKTPTQNRSLLPYIQLPTGSKRIRWSRLPGCLTGLAIAKATETHTGPVVVITSDTPESHRLQTEIGFFLGQQDLYPLIHYPDWETLPYDNFSPHQDIVSDRLQTLYQLESLQHGVLVTPITTILVRTPPRTHIAATGIQFEIGQRIALDQMCRALDQAGYVRVGQVMQHGEFALRGSLLDLFATGSKMPVRIDLFDDEIESMRCFDPDTQRTTTKAERIRLLPARECPLSPETITHFRTEWRSRFEGDPNRCPIYQAISSGIAPAGIEYYLPLFFDHCSSLLEQLPSNTLIIFTAGTEAAANEFWKDTRERYENRRHDRERPIVAPGDLFLSVDAVFGLAKSYPRVQITATSDSLPDCDTEAATPSPGLPLDTPLTVMPMADNPYELLQKFLADYQGRTLFLAESPGRRQILHETLGEHGIHAHLFENWHSFIDDPASIGITIAPLERGAMLSQPLIALITEPQLFGRRVQQKRRRRSNRDAEAIVRDLSELHSGAAVVHEHYGIGRYQGLQTLAIGGIEGEFLSLSYANDDKLYVPVLSMHLISRYTGADPEFAPMHSLGGTQWERARRKAAQKAHDVAAELLDVQARRESRHGYSYTMDAHELSAFESAFPFEETPDQAACIQTVYADLAAARPMDRLVCGDVGFGKTEIAMRAAFVVAYGGKQTAVLVPTTLLAQQHYQTFSDRFADWPCRIAQLSRFRTAGERKQILADLEQGRLDIVIGTHQLLQSNIRFHNLGLVIIDEEHRFGVRQKERLKQLRTESDILTLSATPIPRTLNMAISGLRDLSMIATAPAGRLSIQTFVREWDDGLIREGLQREIRRGGQVFFVHNRVQDIEQFTATIEQLLPEAGIRFAHGQMHERDLERTMLDFYHRRFQVLVCTTIIETGIDIPNANTIFVNRADHYGLAQLHQLRGRVGRSHHRAYAYLLIPTRRTMTANARKRLEAIEALEDLGIGFTLATHDLEIRGAGELLGEGQSGQINEVGYSMYARLLERAVATLQSGHNPELDRPLDDGTEIDLHEAALIPADYLADVNTRLILYKRIASAKTTTALEDLRAEMIDRFGALPDPVRNLFYITELKLQVTPLSIRKIDANRNGARLVFSNHTNVTPERIVHLVHSAPDLYRFEGGVNLRIQCELPDAQARLQAIKTLVTNLTST